MDHGYALRVFAANLKIDAICTFIRKFFATKILLSGKFSFFLTLVMGSVIFFKLVLQVAGCILVEIVSEDCIFPPVNCLLARF